ncbi:magnesium transporter [Microcella putealis]|uniref:Magnesium transporter n=1 Tax=Microcella putealis TaxID=337005 RepID=A0A4Q7LY31_9MICO|nr:CorA family divalent cation transporter [Microcella putealis]RZS58939.1 magnesium transporter [Microcella putealis]TQM23965.1 magnesium transporter [Microcella putealis]
MNDNILNPAPPGSFFDPEALRTVWTQVDADDEDALADLSFNRGVDFAVAGNRVWETDTYVYLPIVVDSKDGEVIQRQELTFALSHDHLVTLQPKIPFEIFDKGIARMRRTPMLAQSPQGVMYALLYAVNESAERVVDFASAALEDMTDEITQATNGYDVRGRDIGVSDMRETMARMNEAEEIVSRIQEAQLELARAARHLLSETSDAPLVLLIETLAADINGVKEHASFEHDKVRYLQQAIMTSLDIKQNQIVKVFTIITAVFLPPTLIATFYGMNFTHMPELAFEHGFLLTTLLTLVAAVIPLWYIKRKGWLR